MRMYLLLSVFLLSNANSCTHQRKRDPVPQPVVVTHSYLHSQLAINRSKNWEQLAERIDAGEITALHELRRAHMQLDRDLVLAHNEQLTKLIAIKFDGADKLPANASVICREISKEWKDAGR